MDAHLIGIDLANLIKRNAPEEKQRPVKVAETAESAMLERRTRTEVR
jgi:hypothetical protein